MAIQTCLTLKALFRLPYRATRAAEVFDAALPTGFAGAEPYPPVAPCLELLDEGEGKVRQHGVGQRRTWHKIHQAVDANAKNLIGIEVTPADWGDFEILAGRINQVAGDITHGSADGAYNTEDCPAAIAERGARATLPPRDGAILWGDAPPQEGLLKKIDAQGREGRKETRRDHQPSLSENRRFRLKPLGDRRYSRVFENQVAEGAVRAAIINTFTSLGMPHSVRAGQMLPGT